MVKGACMAGGHAWQGDMHGRGCAWWGHAWQGGMHGGGVHGRKGVHGRGCVWQGACMAGGHAWLGCAWQGGMCGRRNGHCSGRYASYCNAFLFVTEFAEFGETFRKNSIVLIHTDHFLVLYISGFNIHKEYKILDINTFMGKLLKKGRQRLIQDFFPF